MMGTKARSFAPLCNRSIYVGPIWYVAIVGETPPLDLETLLKHLLRRGDPATLPPEVIELL